MRSMTISGVGKDEKCGRAQYLNSGTKNVHPFCMCPKDPFLATPLHITVSNIIM